MKRKILRLIPTIVFMIVVFLFSNQPAEGSEKTSMSVTETIVTKSTTENRNMDEKEKEDKIREIDPIIRKLAHFTLYAVGGICIMFYIDTYSLTDKKKLLYSMSFIVLYACTDEIHQYFVPGRAMLLKDILIDSSGGLVGILFFMYISKLIKRGKK